LFECLAHAVELTQELRNDGWGCSGRSRPSQYLQFVTQRRHAEGTDVGAARFQGMGRPFQRCGGVRCHGLAEGIKMDSSVLDERLDEAGQRRRASSF